MVNPRWLPSGPQSRRTARFLAAGGAAVLLCGAAANASAAAAQSEGGTAHSRPASSAARSGAITAVASHARPDDSPGFLEGTDSWPISIDGSAPYREPAIGGDYGGYIGMAGNWAYRLGCHGRIAWATTNSAQAYTNFTTYHIGIGTGVYWFMGGPGVDPHYNGTTTEAYDFGEEQASWTLQDISHLKVTYPVVFMDVELPGIAPATDNGWNSVYTSPCSGKVKASYISAEVDRSDFNGYAAYLTSHSSYKAGVYSAPGIWTSIFGTGSVADIPNTYEWTYTDDTSSLSRTPDGWCLQGTSTCGNFFGDVGKNSAEALMWQWSGGGGTFNGYGDFDQIDDSRTP
jgi:hypothetical protein